jgi:tetratricopeptide (TPR) repeat protein
VLYQAALLIPDVDDTARLHRLVQAVTLHHLAGRDRPERISAAVAVLAAAFPAQPWEPAAWPRCARLLPHGLAVADHARDQQLTTAAQGQLLHRMGTYVWSRGLGRERARELLDQAVQVRQRHYPGPHPDTARSLNNLGNVVKDLGDLSHAGTVYSQALAIFQQLHEGDDAGTAMTMDNLAVTLRQRGDHERACDLHRHALAMFRRLYAGDDPRIVESLTNLAAVVQDLGDHQRAQELRQQAAAMQRRLAAPDPSGPAAGLMPP